MLRDCEMDASALLRIGPARPYLVAWPEYGLTVQMQPIALPAAPVVAEPPETSPPPEMAQAMTKATGFAAALEKYLPIEPDNVDALENVHDVPKDRLDAIPEGYFWGLHSVTFETSHWPGPWPGGLNPQTATPDEWLTALPGDFEARIEILRTPELACLIQPGPDGQTWSAVASFDSRTAKLQLLTFSRVGEWITASTLPPWPKADRPQPVPARQEQADTTPPATCFSDGTVPRTSWYEGQLPPDHSSHAIYSQLDARFVYREAGQRMSKLGVQPARDEALVVWTWIGEQLPTK